MTEHNDLAEKVALLTGASDGIGHALGRRLVAAGVRTAFAYGALGVGLVAGNLLGGRLADRSVLPAALGSVGGLIALSATVALAASNQAAFVVAIVCSESPPSRQSLLQTWMLESASQAPTLASAANIGAFNLANTLGSLLAGIAVGSGSGYTTPAWIGAALGVVGLAVTTLAAVRVRRRARLEPTAMTRAT
jgi:DHA1 family inner membrane transport protein